MKHTHDRIAIVAARSGGHIIPGMTYAHQYTEKNPNSSIIFFSTDYALDRSIIQEYTIERYIPLSLVNFPGKNIFRYPLFSFQFIKSFFVSLYQLYTYRPTKVVSMGGYISIPVVAAARLLNIRVELFELNAVPGKAASVIAWFAQQIYVCFDQARGYFKNAQLLPYPMRFNEQERVSSQEARKALGLDPHAFTVLVLGGSQGSQFINQVMQRIISNLPLRAQVIHQTGMSGVTEVREMYDNAGIKNETFAFKHNLSVDYQAADIVIARAGAGTLFEIAFFQKPAIIIPLQTSYTDHQIDNALAMQKMYPSLFTIITQAGVDDTAQGVTKAIIALKNKD